MFRIEEFNVISMFPGTQYPLILSVVDEFYVDKNCCTISICIKIEKKCITSITLEKRALAYFVSFKLGRMTICDQWLRSLI